MTLDHLKYLRIIVPGTFLYALIVGICWTTHWCQLSLPSSVTEIAKLTLAVALGAAYNMSNLRLWMNREYHSRVNENLRNGLLAPLIQQNAAYTALTWRDVRPVFYNIIDRDASLQVQARRAYANGALWTSAADLRAVALMAIFLFLAILIIGNFVPRAHYDFARTDIALAASIGVLVTSYAFSEISTRVHLSIGSEQVDYILTHHRNTLEAALLASLQGRREVPNG